MTACAHTWQPSDAHQALFYRDSGEYLDGILALFLPRAESDKPRMIKIK